MTEHSLEETGNKVVTVFGGTPHTTLPPAGKQPAHLHSGTGVKRGLLFCHCIDGKRDGRNINRLTRRRRVVGIPDVAALLTSRSTRGWPWLSDEGMRIRDDELLNPPTMDLKLFVLRGGQRSEICPNFHTAQTKLFLFFIFFFFQ